MKTVIAAVMAVTPLLGMEVTLPAGSELPVQVEISGDTLVASSENALIVSLEQSVALRMGEDEFLFSIEQGEWLPFSECFTGSLGCTVSEEGEVLVKLDLRQKET